jgi:hypothetical protein
MLRSAGCCEQDWAEHPDVIYARRLVSVGEKVICVEDGPPTWLAQTCKYLFCVLKGALLS